MRFLDIHRQKFSFFFEVIVKLLEGGDGLAKRWSRSSQDDVSPRFQIIEDDRKVRGKFPGLQRSVLRLIDPEDEMDVSILLGSVTFDLQFMRPTVKIKVTVSVHCRVTSVSV